MSEEQVQRIMERIYDDESVTDELADDEAQELLKWGEQQATLLASKNMEDEQLQEAGHQLRRLLSRINRFTGLRSGLETEDQKAIMDEIVTEAQGIGLSVAPDKISEFLQAHNQWDNIENIRKMTALVAPQETTELGATATPTPTPTPIPTSTSTPAPLNDIVSELPTPPPATTIPDELPKPPVDKSWFDF